MTEPIDELVLDGNAVAGALSEIYGDDMTTVLAECASCGNVDHIGELLAYVHAPAIRAARSTAWEVFSRSSTHRASCCGAPPVRRS